jgi:Protein of unknown function (DUF3311)
MKQGGGANPACVMMREGAPSTSFLGCERAPAASGKDMDGAPSRTMTQGMTCELWAGSLRLARNDRCNAALRWYAAPEEVADSHLLSQASRLSRRLGLKPGETMSGDSNEHRPVRAVVWARLLLFVPFVAMLWVSSYDSAEPMWAGIPFFYWYQLLWVIIGAVIIGFVYLVER